MQGSDISLDVVFNQGLLIILLSGYGTEPVPPVHAHFLTDNIGHPLTDNIGRPLTDNGL